MKRIIAFVLAAALLLTAAAQADTAKDITRKVKITANTGDVKLLTDGYITTPWEAKKDESQITVAIPEDL